MNVYKDSFGETHSISVEHSIYVRMLILCDFPGKFTLISGTEHKLSVNKFYLLNVLRIHFLISRNKLK